MDLSAEKLEHLLKRDHSLTGGVVLGIDGHLITLQARAMSVFDKDAAGDGDWRGQASITGMVRGAVSESLDRIAGALAKLNLQPPGVELVINLAPADLPKLGTWLDLPLAIIMLQAAGLLPDLPEATESKIALVGELGLHGDIRRVPGVLSITLAAAAAGCQTIIVPAGNEKECALATAVGEKVAVQICPVATLGEVVEFFRGQRQLENALGKRVDFEPALSKALDFARIRGQERAKEAAILAAAGGHNLLLIGPPGEGKSLLAGAIPSILPKLSDREKVELTQIYSAAGHLERDGQVVNRRPMRPVHHTASKQALVGGGSTIPRPGEVTLAHHGVLFLDELAEFSAATLDAMRQPLEDGRVTISRVGGTLEFPSRFTLVAAMNPCPCGYFGSNQCRCSPADVRRYQAKISGPILDRIDLQVELKRLSTDERFAAPEADVSPALRERVERARESQHRRNGRDVTCNAAIPGGMVHEMCRFSNAGFEHYKQIVDQAGITTRSADRLAKVARTAADLGESEWLEPAHIDAVCPFVIGGLLRDTVRGAN